MASAEPQPVEVGATDGNTSASRGPGRSVGVGTRQSPLALVQTEIVLDRLRAATATGTAGDASGSEAALDFIVRAQTTAGDKNQVTALHQMDAKALWTTELEAGLLAGETDFVVHSLKDMPTQLPAGCSLGAAVARTEPRDCVVMSQSASAAGYRTLADLPAGSVVGTSSVRRLAQIRARYPGLKTQDVRGNVATRMRKLDDPSGPFSALILAATGLQRLEYGPRVSSFLSRREGGWLGAVGQGAVGVEIRHGDEMMDRLCQLIMRSDQQIPATKAATSEAGSESQSQVWLEILAERSLLRVLEGGCSVPVAVESEWGSATESTEGAAGGNERGAGGSGGNAADPSSSEKHLHLYALVASADGKRVVERDLTAAVTSREQAEEMGIELARLLIEGGAEDILKEIRLNRKIIAEAGGA